MNSFYCMMLLTALFTSSCYLQAVPIDSPLSRPVGNATTFREAILANLSLPDTSNSNQDPSSSLSAHLELKPSNGSTKLDGLLPPAIQLLDRCWCNIFSRSGLFEPTDVSRWEMESVLVARKAIEMRAKNAVEENRESLSDREDSTEEVGSNERATGADDNVDGTYEGSSFSLRGLRELLFPTASLASTPKYRLKPSSPPCPSVVSPSEPTVTPFGEPNIPESQHTDPEASPITDFSTSPTPTQRLKLLRPYYDLRPYGIDITLDFHWDRNAHTQTNS
ncbi:hypothetical protein A7U60_g3291 [Sanghuangporus baumii]|uniref:Uncharacterized protein n=1 Tax=Sanghuangporus baumii TaxID=108892 RepID=A0A9Q5I0W3_SANBA|nr:hypothetical protein A7U60_g3291 [Sanghuangporus baumii]